jgi:2-oxoglutaroyl-CoA hydrolase
MSKDYAEMRASVLKDLDGLHYEVDPQKKIGWLWLDRPPLNVVSYRGRSQIAAIMDCFGQDSDVRVVVIRGKNGVYTSGGDVKAFPQIERDGMSHLAWNIAAPERCPKPVICAMEKYAMGVGLELAMACDIRLATKDTLLALPEVTLGQIPGSGGSQRVARIAGLTRAVDMMMLGRRIPAPEAHAWGLVTRVAEDSAELEHDRRGGRLAHRDVGAGAQDHQARPQHLLRYEPERRARAGRPRLREAARGPRLQGRHRRIQRKAQTEIHGRMMSNETVRQRLSA